MSPFIAKTVPVTRQPVLLNSLRWWICKIIIVSFLIPLRGLAKELCESYMVLKWVLPYKLSTNSTVKWIRGYHFGVPCVTAKYPFLVNVPRCFLTTPHEGILVGWRRKSLSPKKILYFKSLQHLVKCTSQKVYGRFDKITVN